MAAVGQNVWYDLMTSDAEAAQRFYTEIVGWKTAPGPTSDPDNPYTMWMAGESGVGGVMRLAEEAIKKGAPAHWLAYTTVHDVDAAAKKTTELGGKVLAEPWAIPEVGRMAVLQDPQGAVFAVYSPSGDMPPADTSALGQFSWSELTTSDYEAAWTFYSELFGWQKRDAMDMGEGQIYFMFNDPAGHTKGGMFNGPEDVKVPPHWLYYVNVEDIDAAVERIGELGGKVLNGPMEVPGGDLVAQCQDPQGAAFAIYEEGEG